MTDLLDKYRARERMMKSLAHPSSGDEGYSLPGLMWREVARRTWDGFTVDQERAIRDALMDERNDQRRAAWDRRARYRES